MRARALVDITWGSDGVGPAVFHPLELARELPHHKPEYILWRQGQVVEVVATSKTGLWLIREDVNNTWWISSEWLEEVKDGHARK